MSQEKKPRILIVEDDTIIASLEEQRLAKLGYSVCGRAASGSEALALVQDQKPDLILLDINLGGEIDGVDIASILSVQTTIPFIYLSANTKDATLKRVKLTKPAGFIKKPFTDDDLRIAIELALKK